jgi:Flp pilus assembly protein TadG
MSGKDKKARARPARGLISILTRYLCGRRGAVAPILALSLIPILGAMGMGAEASNWWLTQRSLQHSADTAALAAAINGGTATKGGTAIDYTNSPYNYTSTSCTSGGAGAGAIAATWFCEAYAAAANMGYTTSTTVTVTPSLVSCPAAVPAGMQCYKVAVSKKVPIYLLNIVGYHGDTTIGSIHYQTITATAIADQPGPPIDFCMLTTNGDFQTDGSHSADLLQCSTFANGNSTCHGNGDNIAFDYASGTASCPSPDVNRPSQPAQCDPYGATNQTIQGVATSCLSSTNISGSIPTNPSCTDANRNSITNGDSSSTAFPPANIITPAMISAGGVIQICGNAALGVGTETNPVNKKGVITSTSVDGCTSAENYAGATNVQIVIYNGSLDLNGCTLETTGTGGMTVMFTPNSGSTTCSQLCVPCSGNNGCTGGSSNGTGGTLDIAAPTSGTFAGLAVVQSANFAVSGSCGSNKSNGVNWCNAGNSPTLEFQGGVYVPNANLQFSGAISKFTGAGALNCIGIVSRSMTVNGTGALFDNFTAGLTADCTAAGLSLPNIQGTHTYTAQLVA